MNTDTSQRPEMAHETPERNGIGWRSQLRRAVRNGGFKINFTPYAL